MGQSIATVILVESTCHIFRDLYACIILVEFSAVLVHSDLCSCCRCSVALSVEFDPTEYAVSEADGSAQLVVKASVPASFDYDVVITTSDVSATGKNAPFLVIVVCVCACVFILSCVFPVTPSPLIILPFS